MIVEFRESFAKDLRAIRDKEILKRLKKLIGLLERSQNLLEVKNIKKLRGTGAYYRVRVGDYRVGLSAQGDVVRLVRVLHRREIYRYFP